MKVKAAVMWEVGQPLDIREVDLDEPKAGEVLVKVGSAGICRSDRHFMHGDAPIAIPVVLGHEGAGTVVQTGPGVTLASEGDQVILSFVPACGRCRSCLEGHSNLCDLHAATGANMLDGTTRLHADGKDIHHMGKVACFAEYAVVPETGVVPLTDSIPMDKAAMIGCSVTTGVGAAIYSAEVKPGSTVAVIGCGGVGLNVIMGAALANAPARSSPWTSARPSSSLPCASAPPTPSMPPTRTRFARSRSSPAVAAPTTPSRCFGSGRHHQGRLRHGRQARHRHRRRHRPLGPGGRHQRRRPRPQREGPCAAPTTAPPAPAPICP